MYKIIITDTVTNETLVDDAASCVIGGIQLANERTRAIGFVQSSAEEIACCLVASERVKNNYLKESKIKKAFKAVRKIEAKLIKEKEVAQC